MDRPVGKGQEKMGDAAASVEKKARQLVYDARYEVKNELQGKKVAPAVVERMVLQRIAKSTAIPAVKARAKEMISKKPVKEEYINSAENTAFGSVANAMFKVFVEGVEKEEAPITLVYEQEMKNAKYHIRVTDPKTGRTYTRMADREKITQLRAKGLKVEMSEYKDATETKKEQEKGAKRAKKDYDGDGKVESSSKEHAGAVHNAIQRERGGTPDGRDTRKEDYLWTEATGTTSVEGQNAKKIDIMKSGEQNAVKVFPEIKEEAVSKSQQKFMAMVCQVKKGKMKAPSAEVAKAAKGMSEKDACDYAETKHKGLPEKVSEEAKCSNCGCETCKCDTRPNKTYRDLLKAKLRSMGKNPLVMMGDEENLEKSYNDMMTASFIKPNKETGKLEPVHVFKEASPTGYNKGERYTGKAGAMSDEEVKRANEGAGERIRKTIKKA